MAWLHDFRDAVQETLEWAAETPCTCLVPADTYDRRRCLAHRAHWLLGGLYYYGTPTRRFPRALTPKWKPAHTVVINHDADDHRWCRFHCRDCGAIAPSMSCRRPYPRANTGDQMTWWADWNPEHVKAEVADEYRPCVWLLKRHFELRPPPQEVLDATPMHPHGFGYDLRHSVGEDRRLPPGEHRRSS